MEASRSPVYEFGEFQIDALKRRLQKRDGSVVPVTPRVFETLLYLVEHHGDLVERDQLMDAVWPDAVVEENNITQNVSTLRRVLGDSQGANRFIVTVPGRGYRFVAEVRPADVVAGIADPGLERDIPVSRRPGSPIPATTGRRVGPLLLTTAAVLIVGVIGLLLWRGRIQTPSPTASASEARPAALEKSIAVLPFANLSGDADNAYFADGIKDEILARLSRVAALKVISRTSTEKYKNAPENLREIALNLGVAHILEGSVQKSGETVRVTVQLIHAPTDTHLWAETYDRKLTDIFQVETEVAQRIATALEATLTGSEARALTAKPTANVEAHEAYLKGRYFWNKRTVEGFKQATEYFSHAVALDPRYAQAWAGLSDALLFLGGESAPEQEDLRARGRTALQKALEIDESLAEAHASLGLLAMNFDWDWPRAETEFKRAIELDPNYATAHQWYGEFLADMGRPDEGISEIRHARELDPLSVIINSDVAKVYFITRHYDEAVEQFKRTLELDPGFAQAHGLLGLTYSAQGLHDKALEQVGKIRGWESDPMSVAWLGYIYGASGNKVETEQTLGRLRDLAAHTYVSPLWMALVHAGAGEKDQAFEWFEKVFQERSVGGGVVLKANPNFDSLRADPRFADLLRRANLAP
ncbi:MAG TPA: winged helix-turn-helix domain-containing protein [Chthoniobacterales bacterium]|jgi:TolB-like protein/DNA-binding winged helix-turn-helix (wHTH) protein|nr:winged helix-turn-helix domain-containing protein [Chthoniobacterales bacterium]